MTVMRPYQNDCVTAIHGEFEKGMSATLALLATGLGKTSIASEFIRQIQPARSLFMAHRDTLVYQARDTIERVAGVKCGIEMAETKVDYGLFSDDQVIISTVQTQNAGNSGKGRMHLFRPNDFEYLFLDEAHHWVAPSFLKVVRHYQQNPRLRTIGFTATADRLDGEALGQVFQSTAYEYDILNGIEDGWLVPINQQFVPVQGLDYSHIKTTAGDLNLGQLTDVMEAEENVQRMIQPTIEAAWSLPAHQLDYFPVDDWGAHLRKKGIPKRTLIFCTSVKQAQRFAEIINRVQAGTATAIWDKVPKDERRVIFKDFASGVLQILVNVGICGEGFDNPAVELMVMARATKSRSLYTQFMGRVLRALPGIVDGPETPEGRRSAIAASAKPVATVMDFVGNSGRHLLITALDILGGRVSAKAIEKAKKKLLASDKAMGVTELLDLTEEQLRKRMEAAKKLAEERRVKLVARSQYQTFLVDPFSTMSLQPAEPRANDMTKKLSPAQTAFMRKFGINPDLYPYAQAKQLFVQLRTRLDKRLATPGQVYLLTKHGYEHATEMPQKEAKKLIDALKNNNWQRPSSKVEDVF